MMTSNKDDWETPKELFDKLDKVYHFTLDPCATKGNAKCAKYYTKKDDGLAQSWKRERVFVNPPYGRRIGGWVRKCYKAAKVEDAIVVALLPSRTDTLWFHGYVLNAVGEEYAPYISIKFIRGRLKFEVNGKPVKNSAPFPSVLVQWGGIEHGLSSLEL
jgi:site-specific DNA-methyltransferase (adenine-specific)